ncbi:hypothetical protein [Streptomyces sp. NPDC005953]|uniref:hypothetical protein n=1 Tax=Streptomyces sp. NPDC005953 TaxID=3156719 RepID=UPI0033FDED39
MTDQGGASLLALDVDDEAAYNSGLVVPTDILRDFNVPSRNPSSGLLRLEQHLADKLPALDRDTVQQSVQLLDQIRVVRDSAIRPKPRPELAAAHYALGCTSQPATSPPPGTVSARTLNRR